jgi:hypothetical protein
VNKLRHTRGRNAKLQCEPVHTHPQRFQKIFPDRIAGVREKDAISLFRFIAMLASLCELPGNLSLHRHRAKL